MGSHVKQNNVHGHGLFNIKQSSFSNLLSFPKSQLYQLCLYREKINGTLRYRVKTIFTHHNYEFNCAAKCKAVSRTFDETLGSPRVIILTLESFWLLEVKFLIRIRQKTKFSAGFSSTFIFRH